MENLKHQIELAIKALGMKNCPLNADVFVRGEQVWLIEVGGRTGATCIPELISIYTGYDWYEKIISYALGEEAEFQSEETHPCMGALINLKAWFKKVLRFSLIIRSVIKLRQ